MNDFEKCVTRKAKGLTYSIDCKLGLWGVESNSKTACEDEAIHYWQQYASDGEYSSIIGGKDVIETLLEATGNE